MRMPTVGKRQSNLQFEMTVTSSSGYSNQYHQAITGIGAGPFGNGSGLQNYNPGANSPTWPPPIGQQINSRAQQNQTQNINRHYQAAQMQAMQQVKISPTLNPPYPPVPPMPPMPPMPWQNLFRVEDVKRVLDVVLYNEFTPISIGIRFHTERIYQSISEGNMFRMHWADTAPEDDQNSVAINLMRRVMFFE